MFGRIKQLLGRSSSRPAPPESPRKDATRAQGNGNDKVLQGRVSKASAKDSSTKKPKKLSSAVAGAGLSGETEGLHRISTLSPHEAAAMENGNVLSIHAVEKSVNALEISGKERLTGESETDGISPPSTADVDLDLDLPNAKLSRQPPEGVSVERLPDTQDATGTSIHGSMEHQYSELHESIEDQIPEDSEDDGGSLLDYEGGEVDEERVVEYLRRQADGDARTKKAWRPEATALYEILDHRGEYPLMPSSWELCFRGIPIPPGLFCPPQSSSEDVTSSEAPSTTILCNRSSEEFRGRVNLIFPPKSTTWLMLHSNPSSAGPDGPTAGCEQPSSGKTRPQDRQDGEAGAHEIRQLGRSRRRLRQPEDHSKLYRPPCQGQQRRAS